MSTFLIETSLGNAFMTVIQRSKLCRVTLCLFYIAGDLGNEHHMTFKVALNGSNYQPNKSTRLWPKSGMKDDPTLKIAQSIREVAGQRGYDVERHS